VADLLVVGLGNPGLEYAHTRHNCGADTVGLLAERHGGRLRDGMRNERAMSDTVRIGSVVVALAVPQTFYNESGLSVAALARRHDVEDPARIVVVHDELDLPPGIVRVKVGGGLAGNNGLRSITQHLKTQDYVRVRIGIGKPPSKERGADHVLSRLPKAERELLDIAIVTAADAVETLLAEGPNSAMTKFNTTTFDPRRIPRDER
jgi:PTH1 family peptidyl-tRNA hydrolase